MPNKEFCRCCPFCEVTIWTIKTRFVAFASKLSYLPCNRPAFFDFCLISLKNGNLYQWFIFFEKKKRKKWKNGWYGIAHYSGTWLKKKQKKLHIFGLKNTNNKKKIRRHIPTPLKKSIQKNKNTYEIKVIYIFLYCFLRGVGILCSSDQKYVVFFLS